MIITFCGHSDYCGSKEDEEKILFLLSKKVGDRPADLYLGGYGSFDAFALSCGKQYQKTHPHVKLLLITPYMTESYRKNRLPYDKKIYDEVVFPELDHVPPKFAILHRNKWMVEKADYIIAYVKYSWGGAYQTYQHAIRKHKETFNLAYSTPAT